MKRKSENGLIAMKVTACMLHPFREIEIVNSPICNFSHVQYILTQLVISSARLLTGFAVGP